MSKSLKYLFAVFILITSAIANADTPLNSNQNFQGHAAYGLSAPTASPQPLTSPTLYGGHGIGTFPASVSGTQNDISCPDSNTFPQWTGSTFICAPITTTNTTGIVANWSTTTPCYFAVDPVGGNDANTGFSCTSAAAAWTIRKQTVASLMTVLPPSGNGRTAELLLGQGTVDSLSQIFTGISGYASFIIRGTGTNSTASAIAGQDDLNDAIYAGAVTTTGMNAAGYTVVAGSTTTSVQLTLFGGGSPAFGTNPGLPVGWRMRFDSATTTTALQNFATGVSYIAATDTLIPNSTLPATPVAGDKLYLEMPGVNTPGIIATSTGQPFNVIGVNFTSFVALRNANVQFLFSGASSSVNLTDSLTTTLGSYTHPVLGVVTPGGGLVATTFNVIRGKISLLPGYGVSTGSFFTNTVLSIGTQSTLVAANIEACGNGESLNIVGNGITIGGPNAGQPVRFVGTGTALVIQGSQLALGNVDFGTGYAEAIVLSGTNRIFVNAAGPGLTGTTSDVGLHLGFSHNSFIAVMNQNVLPTLTGPNGDIALALIDNGNSSAPGARTPGASWALFQTLRFPDQKGNQIAVSGSNANLPPLVAGFATPTQSTTGSTIPAGTIVSFNFGPSQLVPAIASAASTSTGSLYYALTSIPPSTASPLSFGYIAPIAQNVTLTLDTILPTGSKQLPVYLSSTVAGEATITPPAAPNIARQIGTVTSGNGGSVIAVNFNPNNSPDLRFSSNFNPTTSTSGTTVDLSTTGVTAGTYSNPTFTVDNFGRLSASSSGSPGVVTTGGSPLSLGTLPSGVLENVVSGGVSTPTVFSSTTGRIPFGSGINNGLTDSSDLTYSTSLSQLLLSKSGVRQSILKTGAALSVGTTDAHDLDLVANGATVVAARSGGQVSIPSLGPGVGDLVRITDGTGSLGAAAPGADYLTGNIGTGVVQAVTTAGATTLSSFSATSGRIPFGSGTNGNLTDNAGLSYTSFAADLNISGSASSNAAGIFISNTSSTSGVAIRLTNDVNKNLQFLYNGSTVASNPDTILVTSTATNGLIFSGVSRIAFATSALPTTAQALFVQLQSMPGVPSNTALNVVPGQIPIVIDSAHDRFYAFNGSFPWKIYSQYDGSLSGAPGILKTDASGVHSIAQPNVDFAPAGNYITALVGDVAATGPGSVTATIGANKVTYAKIQTVTGAKLLGNPTTSAANISEISIGSGLSLSVAGVLSSTGSGGTVTNVTGIAPIAVVSGTTTPAISLNIDSTLAVASSNLGRAAISGDGTIAAGSNTFVLTNIPNATPASGDINFTAITAPATPTAGHGLGYFDSASQNFAVKNALGIVNHGVQTNTGATHEWINSIADNGAVTASQPSYTDLAGSVPAITSLTGDGTATGPGAATFTISANAVTNAKFRQSGANTLVGNPTASTANVVDVGVNAPLFLSGGNLILNIDGTSLITTGGTTLVRNALTGDISCPAASNSCTLLNIPTATTAAGYINFTAIVAPAVPSIGHADIYIDSTQSNLTMKLPSGTTANLVIPKTCSAGQSITEIDANGTATCAAGSSGTVTAVTATAPLNSSGGTTPNLTLSIDSTLAISAGVLGRAAISGDGSISAGSNTFTLNNIPNETTLPGDILATASSAPATPAAGFGRIWYNSASQNLAVISEAGTIKHGVQTNNGTAHHFLTSITDTGFANDAQPAFSDLTGTATLSQLSSPTGTGLWGISSGVSDAAATVVSTGLTRASGNLTVNLSTGVSGGQTLIGGTTAGDNLTISTTSNGTKGKVIFSSTSGMVFDEANNRLGIGVTPTVSFQDQANVNGDLMAAVINTSTGTSARSLLAIGSSSFGSPSLSLLVDGVNYSGIGGLYGPGSAVWFYNASATSNLLFQNVAGATVFSIGSATGGGTAKLTITNGGHVQVADLGAGGITKSVASTGQLAVASASDLSAALGTGSSTGIVEVTGGVYGTVTVDSTSLSYSGTTLSNPGKVRVNSSDASLPDYLTSKIVSQSGTLTITPIASNTLMSIDGVVFGASGPSHAVGMVPDPGASAGTNHYLNENGTWQVPGHNFSTTYSVNVLNTTAICGGWLYHDTFESGSGCGGGFSASALEFPVGGLIPQNVRMQVWVTSLTASGTYDFKFVVTRNGTTINPTACNFSSASGTTPFMCDQGAVGITGGAATDVFGVDVIPSGTGTASGITATVTLTVQDY